MIFEGGIDATVTMSSVLDEADADTSSLLVIREDVEDFDVGVEGHGLARVELEDAVVPDPLDN